MEACTSDSPCGEYVLLKLWLLVVVISAMLKYPTGNTTHVLVYVPIKNNYECWMMHY